MPVARVAPVIDRLDYQAFMQPLLALAADGRDWTLAEARARIASDLGLSDDDLRARLPSGRQTVFANRVGWAKTWLTKAGLLESPRRGVFRLTVRGRRALDEAPGSIDNDYLRQFETFLEFEQKGGPADAASEAPAQMFPAADDDVTRSIIKQDRLGLDIIYILARRWTDVSVGRTGYAIRFSPGFSICIGSAMLRMSPLASATLAENCKATVQRATPKPRGGTGP
ncbi:MAG: hypothetical protein EA398_14600 [Deltaproteobacteria bacterium]|nr:MAG: hypothetical protein EA398_14600 [Deltaproteobacteria bacterium]